MHSLHRRVINFDLYIGPKCHGSLKVEALNGLDDLNDLNGSNELNDLNLHPIEE